VCQIFSSGLQHRYFDFVLVSCVYFVLALVSSTKIAKQFRHFRYRYRRRRRKKTLHTSLRVSRWDRFVQFLHGHPFDQHKHTGHSRHTPLRVTCVENGHIYALRVEMFLTRSVFILHILFIFKYIYFAWNRTTHPTGRNSKATVQTADR